MEEQDPQLSFDLAVQELVQAGIEANRKAYGFSANVPDVKGVTTAQCGFEHDGGISISLNTGVPPGHWFFRPTIQGMVELLIAAKSRLKANSSQSWLDALREVNNQNEVKKDG
jgi:hypothetical protein